MGLDITAYETLKLVRATNEISDEEIDDGSLVHLYLAGFPVQADGMAEGLYEASSATHGFRAGSYGGYNRWRYNLAKLVNTTDEAVWANPQPGPFVELINFSDAEGFIGPKTCAKLTGDFAEWKDRAVRFPDEHEGWFLRIYSSFHEAFELASKNGCVKFH